MAPAREVETPQTVEVQPGTVSGFAVFLFGGFSFYAVVCLLTLFAVMRNRNPDNWGVFMPLVIGVWGIPIFGTLAAILHAWTGPWTWLSNRRAWRGELCSVVQQTMHSLKSLEYLSSVMFLRKRFGVARDHLRMELHKISVFVALHVFGDRSEGFKQTDRDRDAVVAVQADLVERSVQCVGKGKSAHDNSQIAFVVAAIRRGQLSLRQSPHAAPKRSMQFIAVNGSLIPGERARTAISTNSSIAHSISCRGVRRLPTMTVSFSVAVRSPAFESSPDGSLPIQTSASGEPFAMKLPGRECRRSKRSRSRANCIRPSSSIAWM